MPNIQAGVRAGSFGCLFVGIRVVFFGEPNEGLSQFTDLERHWKQHVSRVVLAPRMMCCCFGSTNMTTGTFRVCSCSEKVLNAAKAKLPSRGRKAPHNRRRDSRRKFGQSSIRVAVDQNTVPAFLEFLTQDVLQLLFAFDNDDGFALPLFGFLFVDRDDIVLSSSNRWWEHRNSESQIECPPTSAPVFGYRFSGRTRWLCCRSHRCCPANPRDRIQGWDFEKSTYAQALQSISGFNESRFPRNDVVQNNAREIDVASRVPFANGSASLECGIVDGSRARAIRNRFRCRNIGQRSQTKVHQFASAARMYQTFESFRSRWVIPFWNAKSNPEQISCMILRARARRTWFGF